MDATALAAAIAGGHLTCAQAMEAALAAEAALRRLGSVCRLEPTLGRAAAKAADSSAPAARGPLHGVPFLGKDLGSFAAGLRPAAGSPALRLRLADPGEDSALFARFRAAGLVPFGLTTVPEFGLALTSEPPGGPVACNPWNDALSPGGSSGGAAAAVAAGIVALAHATDAAGSIRVPAACCGLVGLKPSRGVIPGGPDFGNHLMGIASELVLARSVRDVALVFAAVCGDGADPAVSQVALAVPGRAGAAQQTAARAAALALAGAGVSVRSIAAPDGLGAETAALARLILSVSLAEWLDALGVGADEISPLATAVAAEGRALPATALFVASRQMAVLGDRVQRMFDGVQAVLSPVLSGPPPRIGHFDPARADPAAHFAAMEALAPNAALANVAGCPALVLPFGTDAAGLPVGVQLMGPVGSDRALLALAARLEALAPPLVFPYPIAGLA